MKPSLAYFVMVHHKPQQFEWLMEAIADPGDLILVHVDLKSRLGIKASRRGVMKDVRRIVDKSPNARLMTSRATNWGGWSLSRILIDAIREALRSDPDWSYFVNLSGQCYPLKPLPAIREALADRGDAVHVELLEIDQLPADDWHRAASPMLETPLRALRLSGRQEPPKDFELLHKGSQWVMLPREFCEWMVTSPMLPRITRYLRRRLLSDELIMQALVWNSPFRDRLAPHYGREIIWPGPKVLTIDDLPLLRSSDALFARKFDLEKDRAVLEALAESGGYTVPSSGAAGS
ncbi:beta-1,6-N-acetylglucosaminyltransferase [Glacieibacterium sp.]|uniref:beta-1,6-N-acetylglucosaminyltransferase n=1 Tax=Glacieibacterium sp. TaxID=2860237 RepID=UPI003B002AFE